MTLFNDDYEEQVFKWLQFEDIQLTNADMLSGVSYEETIQRDMSGPGFLRDQAIYRLNARVLGKELPSFTERRSEIVHIPKNPWQMFKDIYADKWFMRAIVNKWPVKLTKTKVTLTATWDQWAVYPWIKNIPVSPQWQPVRIMMPAKVRVTKEDLLDESTIAES